MNREEFVERMTSLGYTLDGIADLVHFPSDKSNLALRTFNFVRVKADQYEIWQSDERDLFFRASASYGVPFIGSLEDAYLWVYNDKAGL